MSGILILMHNSVNVKICAKMTERFLQEHAFDSKIIAPVDFVEPGVNQQQMPGKIANLILTNNEIRIIFFEANLGYPAQEELRDDTKQVLSRLIENYPDATFILKSQTDKAIKNAQAFLQEKRVPSEQIFPAGSMMIISDKLKQLMCDAFEEDSLKIKFR